LPPAGRLLVKADLREYGYNSFPQYAPKLAKWIDANYSMLARGESKALPWTIWQRAAIPSP